MKKPVYLRIFLLLLLYAGVLTLIVMIQFPKQGLFTQHIGNLIVTGQHRLQESSGRVSPSGEGRTIQEDGSALLTGKASVIFGGMEFCLGPGAEGSALRFFNGDGRAEELLPEALNSSRDTALFRFPGGTELSFTAYPGRSPELRISCTFSGGYYALELPFKPLRKTVIGSSGDGRLSIDSEGLSYSFGPTPLDTARFVLLLRAESPALIYHAVLERETLIFEDHILPEAENPETYTAALSAWIDRNYSLWGRMTREQNDEDVVVAFASESFDRNVYRAAVSVVPSAFLNGNRRTYESSVYLGGLDRAALSLGSTDRSKMERLSRSIQVENSLDFLMEEYVVEYLTVRGGSDLLNYGAGVMRSFNPEELTLELTPGILEAYTGWKAFRPQLENPFERFIDKAESLVSESLCLIQNRTRVFAAADGRVDIEFNLRLGKALLLRALEEENDSWAALARSIILSSLLQGEESPGTSFFITDEDTIEDDPDSFETSTARLYRILRNGRTPLAGSPNYPRTLIIETGINPIWAWTAASGLSSSWEGGDVMDIAVVFPAGETHYMIIRGIPDFEKIQLYGMDYRTDPQFERYDSSGWTYTASSQTLMVKMRHRAETEHIRIYFETPAEP